MVDKVCLRTGDKNYRGLFTDLLSAERPFSLRCEAHEHTQKYFDTPTFNEVLRKLASEPIPLRPRVQLAARLLLDQNAAALPRFIIPYFLVPSYYLEMRIRASGLAKVANETFVIQMCFGDHITRINPDPHSHRNGVYLKDRDIMAHAAVFANAGNASQYRYIYVASDSVVARHWFIRNFPGRVLNCSVIGAPKHMADMNSSESFHEMIAEWMWIAQAHSAVTSKASSFGRSARCSFGSPDFLSSPFTIPPSPKGKPSMHSFLKSTNLSKAPIFIHENCSYYTVRDHDPPTPL